jgi:hypothetical protein
MFYCRKPPLTDALYVCANIFSGNIFCFNKLHSEAQSLNLQLNCIRAYLFVCVYVRMRVCVYAYFVNLQNTVWRRKPTMTEIFFLLCVYKYEYLRDTVKELWPVTVAARSKVWTVFARSDAGFESDSGHGCLVCAWVYSVFMMSCVQVAALRRADHSPQRSYRQSKMITELNKRPGSWMGSKSQWGGGWGEIYRK